MNEIAMAALVITAIGVLGGVILVAASRVMGVEEDGRVAQIAELLPGANCGACGAAGCADYAKNVVQNGWACNRCIPGGKALADRIAAVMGADAGEVEEKKAVVRCQGNRQNTTDKYRYEGVESCRANAALFSGRGACEYGCLGFGDCVAACPFDAIVLEDGLARVERDKCTGCGACVRACPHDLIALLPASQAPAVLCRSRDTGARTRQVCRVGCIACRQCVKACPVEAISMEQNVAVIDPGKCIACQKCVSVCPVHTIGRPDRGRA